jgi:hypothetical protein
MPTLKGRKKGKPKKRTVVTDAELEEGLIWKVRGGCGSWCHSQQPEQGEQALKHEAYGLDGLAQGSARLLETATGRNSKSGQGGW